MRLWMIGRHACANVCRLLVLGALLVLISCDLGDDEDDWSGDPDRFEYDDNRNYAKEQQVQAYPQEHTLSPDGDVDWIRFRVTGVCVDTPSSEDAPLYEFYLSDRAGCTTSMEVWSETEGELASHEYYIYGWPDVPGIYYLRVEDEDDTGGEYSSVITMWKDSSPSRADLVATWIDMEAETETGTVQEFDVRLGNQGNYAAGDFTVKAYLSTDKNLDIGVDIEIGSEECTGLAKWTFTDTFEMSLDFSILGLPSGPVYVLLYVDSEGLVTESDEWNNVGVFSTVLGLAPETFVEAEPVSVASGTTSGLMLYPADDEDLFEFQVDTSVCDYYEMWTENLRAGADTRLEILNSELAAIEEAEDGGLENGASYLSHYFDTSGTYYLRVTDENGGVGGYDLSVVEAVRSPDANEPDNDIRSWRTLKRGIPESYLATHNFAYPGDQDWMVYGVTADDENNSRTHTIETLDLVGCDTVLRLYDDQGVIVATNDDVSETDPSSCLSLYLDAGLYYVRVTEATETAGGTYKIQAGSN